MTASVKTIIFFSLFILTTALLIFNPNFDTDFGWHYQTGHYITSQHKIPHTDIFSFSLPHHLYVAHSWLTDVITYFIFNLTHHNGISLFYGLVIGLGILIGSNPSPKLSPNHFLAYLFTLAFIPFTELSIGLRTQAITFLFLAVVFYLTNHAKLSHHTILSPNWLTWFRHSSLIFLPLTFLLWANLHAGFSLGLFFLAAQLTWLIFKSNNPHKSPLIHTTILIFLACLLATLANPYGYKLHLYIYSLVQNPTPNASNLDWLPYLNNPLFSFRHKFFTLLWSTSILLSRSKLTNHKLLTVLFLLLSLYSTRFLLPLSLILITSTPTLIHQFISTLKPHVKQIFVYPLALAFVLFLLLKLPPRIHRTLSIHQTPRSFAANSTGLGDYPYQATQILNQIQQPLNILNYYDWGGYLIMNSPTHKIFIDGRMDNFFHQGKSLKTYHDLLIYSPNNWQPIFKQFPISAVLVPTSSPMAQQLSSQGWQTLYQDPTTILLLHPNITLPTQTQSVS